MNKTTLVTIPFSGGNAYSYREFFSHLPDWIEPLPLELPGHGKRMAEPLLDEAHAMAEDLAGMMAGRWTSRTAIYGHSLGALLAYHLARIAIDAGACRPLHLFVSGHTGPGSIRRGPPRHDLPRAEFIAMLGELGGSVGEALENEELMELFEPILRADFAAADTYRPRETPALDVPITAMIGRDDEGTPSEELTWRAATRDVLMMKVFDGGHFFINDHAKSLARSIGEALNGGADGADGRRMDPR
jgi:surfactin synthase thioesterase subunit